MVPLRVRGRQRKRSSGTKCSCRKRRGGKRRRDARWALTEIRGARSAPRARRRGLAPRRATGQHEKMYAECATPMRRWRRGAGSEAEEGALEECAAQARRGDSEEG